MGDDDNGLAIVAHTAQHVEKLLGFLRGQHGGGLIQNQYIRAAIEHLDDFHGLLFGNRHFMDLLVGVDIKAIALADLADALGHLADVIAILLIQPQHDVFRSGKHVHELKVLMNHADAQVKRISGRTDDGFLTPNVDMSFIREVNAGNHIHQGGLAAAVFSQNR